MNINFAIVKGDNKIIRDEVFKNFSKKSNSSL